MSIYFQTIWLQTVQILYILKKFKKNPENIQSRSKIREISSQGQKSESGIPENFLYKIFIKSHFRGGLCYKFFLKNDCNPQKSRFFAFFMYSTFLHRQKDWCSAIWKQNGQNGRGLDFAQVRTLFFSGKKPDPENPGKIRIWNFLYLWSDIKIGQHNCLFYRKM